MMQKTAGSGRKYLFTERLRKQLAQIHHHPLTLIEAPSGFGKTTAVREYLREGIPEGAQEYWYTCLGEPAAMTWGGICGVLSHVDIEAADKLKRLGMPTAETLMYLPELVTGCHCAREVYIVVDNFQLAECEVPHELISVFSMHRCAGVHLIFITQHFSSKPQVTFHNANIHMIESSAFFFDRESTADLFRMEGIRLTPEELDHVHASTEGWVSAIRLQIMGYKQTGSFDYTADIHRLVETAIWHKLTGEEREFLLSVCVRDSFTAPQAAFMLGVQTLGEPLLRLLKSSDFMRFFPREGIYTIHSILLDYLRHQFYQNQPGEFREKVLRRAGQSYAADGNLLAAARLFFSVRDFDAVLSLPFSTAYLINNKEKGLLDFIAALTDECPLDTLCNYPGAMLMFSCSMLFGGRTECFEKLTRLLQSALKTNRVGLGKEELRRLGGELVFALSLTQRSGFKGMTESVKEALGRIGGPSSFVTKDLPWNGGCPSVLCLLWRRPGGLDETLCELEDYLPHFQKLSSGQGSGAANAARAEALLMRGEDEKAKILCYTAIYEARSKQQICICLSAELLLARIAILQGDAESYMRAAQNIRGYAKDHPHAYVMRMADMCMTALSFLLHTQDNAAKWLFDLEDIERIVYAQSVPYAQILFSHNLLAWEKYSEFLGVAPLIMKRAQGAQCLFAQLYQHIFLAAANRKYGNDHEAAAHVGAALALALPDRIYLPFSHMWENIRDLVESAPDPDKTACSRHARAELATLCNSQALGVRVIRKAFIEAKSPLTPREREVALLTRGRLSRKEIAARLFISEQTVKSILQNVYLKLDVHSKYELDERDF